MYVRVDLRPSSLLRKSRAGFHIAALLCLPWVNVDASLLILVALMVIVSFLRGIRSDSGQPRAILFIDGAPRLLIGDRVLEVDLQDHVYCTSFLQLLHFTQPQGSGDRQFCVVILSDSSSAGNRRRLRTLLRWHALATSANQPAERSETNPV